MNHSLVPLSPGEEMLFQAIPGNNVMLLPNAPVFTIVEATADYLRTAGKTREELIGIGLFEAFPSAPDDLEKLSETRLCHSLEQAIATKQNQIMPLHRYDIQNSEGVFEERYWAATNKPLLDETGNIRYLLHSAEDLTVKIKAAHIEERLKSLEKSYNLFSQVPVIIGVVAGLDYTIELANECLLEVWDRTSDVIGKPLFGVLPELESQGFRGLLDEVRKTGNPFHAVEHPLILTRRGRQETRYFDFVYKPYYHDDAEQVTGILAVGHDVTKQVQDRQKFKNIIEQAVDPILILRGDDMVLEVANDALFQLWNVDRSALGKTFLEILPEMREQGFLELLRQVFYTGKPFQGFETPAVFTGLDGKERTVYFDFTYQPYREADGSITGVLVTARDVSGQVLAKKMLEESERKFRQMVEQTPVAMLVYRGEELILDTVNQHMLQLLHRPASIIGKPVLEVLPEFESQPIFNILREVYLTGEPYFHHDMPVQLRNGTALETRHFSFSYTPIKEADKVVGVIEVAVEVTEQVAARKQVEERESYFRRLADTVPAAIWITEQDGSCSYLSKEWYNLTAQTEAEAMGFGWLRAVHPDDRLHAEKSFVSAAGSQGEFRVLYRLCLKDGNYRWVIDSGRPRYGVAGQFEGYTGFILDVHEQKLAEEALRSSEARQRRLSESNLIGVFNWNLDGLVIDSNDAFLRMIDYTREELEAEKVNWYAMTPSEHLLSTQMAFDQLRTTGVFNPFEKQFIRKDGSRVDVLIGGALHDDQPNFGIAWAVDITERKQIEADLRASEQRWQQLANVMPVFVWTAYPDGRLNFLNDHWYGFTGLSEEQSLGFGWTQVLHPDDVPRCLEVWEHARSRQIFYEVEVRYRSKEGLYRWVIGRGVPIRNNQDEVIAWYGTSTDIHDQKMLNENLEHMVAERTAELQRSNSSLENFAYAASHDLKEPIRKIHFFADRLKEQLQDMLSEDQRRNFERLELASRRMGLLVDDLLAYSEATKGGTVAWETVDLNQKVQNVLVDLELEIQQKAASVIVGPLPTIKGNKRHIQQLFQNLIGNALKYSKPGIAPQVHISARSIRGAELLSTSKQLDPSAAFHLIEVSDNGIGFNQADAERIFNVFTRLHGNAEYRGSGVGLAIAQRVVESHNGYIWAKSTPGAGATFFIAIPKVEND